MIWFMVMQVVSTLVELDRPGRKSESDKGLEILLLRRQLAIRERKQERSPRLVRGEKLLIINQAHLRRVMRDYVEFFNTARSHHGIEQQIPMSPPTPNSSGPIRCRNMLGGILHDYYRDAA